MTLKITEDGPGILLHFNTNVLKQCMYMISNVYNPQT